MRWMLAFALLAGCAKPWIAAKVLRPEPAASWSWTYPAGMPSGSKLIWAMSVYSPEPTDEQLAATDTIRYGEVGRREGAVAFCVTVEGKVRSAETEELTGDSALDEALCDAVRKWRFKPAIVDGRPSEACTTARFVVTFE